MAALPFPQWAPDLSSYKSKTTQFLSNVFARGDGYGPANALLAFTSALPSACRGYFYGRKSDGSVLLFAGTATNLYLLNNTNFTWSVVSLGGGPYSSLSNDANWQFAQFGSIVFATQQNVALQFYDMSSSTAFANQSGSPPQASYISIVGQFLVLSGLLSNKFRIQWCAIGDPTGWTAGVNQSDFQDFPDGGIVRGVAGGEYGTIFQDTAIRSMVYAAGSPFVFQITRIADDLGLLCPYGIVRAGDAIYFPSTKGFMVIEPGSLPTPIGKERVDRTFFANIDQANLQLCIGFADPASTRVGWAFKSLAGQANLFDTLYIFDRAIGPGGSWTPVYVSGEYIASLSKPGITLEGLDAIAPGALTITGAASNGGNVQLTVGATATLLAGQIKAISGVVGTTEANGNHTILTVDSPTTFTINVAFVNAYVSGGIVGGSLDAMTQSLDSFPASAAVALSAVTPLHALGFFNGQTLEATLDTSEQGGDFNRVSVKRGFRVDTDAPAVFGSIGVRENLQNAVAYSAETLINFKGECPARVSARYGRFRARVPAGTLWSFITAVEPMVGQEGKR